MSSDAYGRFLLPNLQKLDQISTLLSDNLRLIRPAKANDVPNYT